MIRPPTNLHGGLREHKALSSSDRDSDRTIATCRQVASHESQMNLTALIELRKAFISADVNGTDELDEEEFVRAFKSIKALGKGME